jgi:DNA-binding transcriptional LysR family regulator
MSVSMQLSDHVGRRMKLQDLRVFMSVMQAGSMGKAAQSLNISQPVVSKAIADLEHALGVRLFDRHRRGIEATEYGRALLDCGMTIFDDLRQGVKNIEFLADPTTGEVRIGNTLPSTASSFIAGIIDRLSRRYPRMVFHVVPGPQDTLRRELNARNLDLVITRGGRPFKDEQFDFDILYDDPFVVLAGVKNPWARRRRIELAELVNEPWALATLETSLVGAAIEAFRASGLDYPRATVVSDSAEVRVSLVAAGRFLTIAPSSLLRLPTRRPELKALPVELPMAFGPVGIVTLKNRTLNPVAKLFIRHAHEAAKPLAKRR